MKNTVLFGSPIYSFSIDPTTYDKEKIMNTILKDYNQKGNESSWDPDSSIHITYDLHKHDNELSRTILETMTPVYTKVILEFFSKNLSMKKNFAWKLLIENCTVATNSSYMKTHRHIPDAIFSCVHYLSFDPKQHSGIRFSNPNDWNAYAQYLFPEYYDSVNNQSEDHSYLYSYWNYTPIENEMILFSGLLPHEIPKQSNVSTPRISLVMNIIGEST